MIPALVVSTDCFFVWNKKSIEPLNEKRCNKCGLILVVRTTMTLRIPNAIGAEEDSHDEDPYPSVPCRRGTKNENGNAC